MPDTSHCCCGVGPGDFPVTFITTMSDARWMDTEGVSVSLDLYEGGTGGALLASLGSQSPSEAFFNWTVNLSKSQSYRLQVTVAQTGGSTVVFDHTFTTNSSGTSQSVNVWIPRVLMTFPTQCGNFVYGSYWPVSVVGPGGFTFSGDTGDYSIWPLDPAYRTGLRFTPGDPGTYSGTVTPTVPNTTTPTLSGSVAYSPSPTKAQQHFQWSLDVFIAQDGVSAATGYVWPNFEPEPRPNVVYATTSAGSFPLTAVTPPFHSDDRCSTRYEGSITFDAPGGGTASGWAIFEYVFAYPGGPSLHSISLTGTLEGVFCWNFTTAVSCPGTTPQNGYFPGLGGSLPGSFSASLTRGSPPIVVPGDPINVTFSSVCMTLTGNEQCGSETPAPSSPRYQINIGPVTVTE